MAAGKLLAKALSFLSPNSSPLHPLRRLSTADLKSSPAGNSILHFLRGLGLADEALAGFPPRLHLVDKVGKDLPAKFDLLLTRGFSLKEAARVLRTNELLRHISLIHLRRRLENLRTIVSDDADLLRIVNRARWTLCSDRHIQRMAENVSKFRGWGVSDSKIKSLMLNQPRFFQLKPECIDEAADRAVAEFGFRRDAKTFVCAVNILWMSTNSKRESRFRVCESFGWERSDIMVLFKRFPTFISLAEATLVKKLAFLMNELGNDPFSITKNPAILGYSMEKRLRPRLQLVNALVTKNLLRREQSINQTLSMSEKKFMEKYVVTFLKKEPDICNTYINTVASLKQQPSDFVDQSLSLS